MSPLALFVAGSALAQGGDDCSIADPISGTGTWLMDTGVATTSDFAGGGPPCPGSGNGGQPESDLFFQWTATASADTQFDMFGSVALGIGDALLSVHEGTGCSAICVDHDNGGDTGSDAVVVVAGVTAGDTYLVQCGSWLPNQAGLAVLNVGPAAPVPSNDDCASPTPLSGVGNFAYSTVRATGSGFNGGNSNACGVGQLGSPGRDVFFTWTADTAGSFVFETCGTFADTTLSAHAGADCSAVCVEGNNDSCGQQSQVLLTGVAVGDTFLIVIGDFSGSSNGHVGSLAVTSVAPPPTNDTCATPTAISGVGSFNYDSTTATTTLFDGLGAGACSVAENMHPGHRDVFFAWTALTPGDFVIDTCGTGVNTVMNIHDGDDCSATCLTSNDTSPCSTAGEAGVTLLGLMAGDVRLVQIGEWEEGLGHLGILSVTSAIPAPPNDDCSNATPISGFGGFAFDTTAALTSGFGAGIAPCQPPGVGGPESDVFFQWTATADADVLFDLIGSGLGNSVLQLHAGVGCGAVCAFQDDDGAGFPEAALIVPGVQTGDMYLIQVGSFTQAQVGAGLLNVSVAPVVVPNDTCATPTPISGLGFFNVTSSLFTQTTTDFNGGDEVNCGDAVGMMPPQNDHFFVWTAPCDGSYTVTDCAINSDNAIDVHLGSDCSATCIGGAGDGSLICGSPNVDFTWTATEGESYLIQVGGWGGTDLVNGDIEILQNTAPCDDPPGEILVSCVQAQPHYAGGPADLSTSSLTTLAPSGLHLECTDGPPGEFGFFLVSAGSSGSLNIFNGVLCLEAPQGRYNPNIATNQGLPQLNSLGQFNGSGVLVNLASTSVFGTGFDVPLELPFTPPGTTIASGSTWSFTCWYRDQIAPLPNPGSSANFSNVVDVTFP